MYFRVMKWSDENASQAALQKVLADANIPFKLLSIESHPRGGFALQLDIQQSYLLSLGEYLYEQDWRLVV